MKEEFRKELEQLINRHSMENGSDTPDYILAEYMADCLAAFDRATQRRDQHMSADMPEPAQPETAKRVPIQCSTCQYWKVSFYESPCSGCEHHMCHTPKKPKNA